MITQKDAFFTIGETRKFRTLQDLSLGDLGVQVPKGCVVDVYCQDRDTFKVFKDGVFCFNLGKGKDNGLYFESH